MSKFAAQQPKIGDVVALCPHASEPGRHHWFRVDPAAFEHVETHEHSSFDWICACDDCADTFGESGEINLTEFAPWEDWADPNAPIIIAPAKC